VPPDGEFVIVTGVVSQELLEGSTHPQPVIHARSVLF